MRKIAIIPKIIKTYKNQYEISVERDLVIFLKKKIKLKNIQVLIDANQINKFDLFISSGGNNVSNTNFNDELRNKLEAKVLRFCVSNNKKYIGICYGAQSVNKYFKGKLTKKKIVKKMNYQINICQNDFNLRKGEKYKVNSYKNFCVQKVSTNFKIIGKNNKNNSIEIFRHKIKKIYCFMWHPERLHLIDDKLIKYFKKLCN